MSCAQSFVNLNIYIDTYRRFVLQNILLWRLELRRERMASSTVVNQIRVYRHLGVKFSIITVV